MVFAIIKLDSKNRLNFNLIFERFIEIYWPIIANYGLDQSDENATETMTITELIEIYSKLYNKNRDKQFGDLDKRQQKEIIKNAKVCYKGTVIGQLYVSTKAIFYSFSLKEEWLEINPSVMKYIKKHAEEIQDMIYMAWSEVMVRANGETKEKQVHAALRDVFKKK